MGYRGNVSAAGPRRPRRRYTGSDEGARSAHEGSRTRSRNVHAQTIFIIKKEGKFKLNSMVSRYMGT